MQTNNFKSLSMGVLCALSLVGCMEKDLYQAPEEKTADEYFEKIQKESLHLGHLKGQEKDKALMKYYNYTGNSKGIYF